MNYKAVPSGLDISRRVADCLEQSAAVGYQPSERAKAIRAINDVLQGRSTRTVEELLAELEKCGEGQAAVRQDVLGFQTQKELLWYVYNKSSSKRYAFPQYNRSKGRALKVINQDLYDRAAKNGFPLDFFRESYFDKVTFYCLPDYV